MEALCRQDSLRSQESPEFQKIKNSLYHTIHDYGSFEDALPYIEHELLELLEAERLTVYQRGRNEREIVSRYKTGGEVKEYRLPLNPTSIASFVALTHQPLCIADVYDRDALQSIHPKLTFDHRYDHDSSFRTKSMVIVPIKCKDTLLGVLQIINKKNGAVFTQTDLSIAKELSTMIAQKFHYDLQATHGPFDYLVHGKKTTAKRLAELALKAEKEKKSVAYLLVTEDKLIPEEVGESLARYYQVPFCAYDPELMLPAVLLKKLKISYLRRNLWVPISLDTERVVILIDNPNDTGRILEIQQLLGARSYEFRVGFAEDILRYLGLGSGSAFGQANCNLADLVERLDRDDPEPTGNKLKTDITEDEPAVVQLVHRLIADARRLRASDIHIEPGKGSENASVRMRVDGECRTVLQIPGSHIRAIISRIKIISHLDIAERRRPQDGKIFTTSNGQPVELRVATLPTVNGESVVLRLLAPGGVLPLNKLNFSGHNEKHIKKMIAKPHGMVLVVGPTGSGKTTTLHAVLDHINTTDRKIWTAEDPVEITQKGLQQVQVAPKIGLDFAAAMRAFLRADPDVILIGEMRDRETARIGIEASLTGHLVFSTLHTNSAPETITRLLDFGLDPFNFADALLGILAQRLVRTLCNDCKQPYTPSDEEYEQLIKAHGSEYSDKDNIVQAEGKLFKPVGCKRCGKTGYKGRTGVHELLVATPEIKKLIIQKNDIATIRTCAVQQGMRTLVQDGIAKVLQGQTDLLQLRKVTA